MMFESILVKCKKCNEYFSVITIDGKIIGRFFCPSCGGLYEDKNN